MKGDSVGSFRVFVRTAPGTETEASVPVELCRVRSREQRNQQLRDVFPWPSEIVRYRRPARRKPLTGWHVLAILLTAFVVMLLANGALIYIATDGESDFRALIEVFC